MVVDTLIPWEMRGGQEEGDSLSDLVKDTIKVQSDAKEEVAFKQEIIQKCQPLSARMKTLLSSNVPSKKWTLEEGECQIDVLPDGTYRFEFPHGPNPSRCAWLQIGSDIVEGWFPFDTLANSVLFRTDSNEPLMAQKIKIDVVLKTAESILGKIEALQQMGTDAVVIDTAHQVDNALEA